MLADEVLKVKTTFAKNGGTLPLETAKHLRINKGILDLLMKRGTIELKGDAYRYIDFDEIDPIKIITRRYGECILSSLSALNYYGYTEKPDYFYISVGNGVKISKSRLDFPPVKLLHYKDDTLYSDTVNNGKFLVASRERAMCELFKNSDKFDDKIIFSAFSAYTRDSEKNIDRLFEIAREFSSYRKVKMWIGSIMLT